MTAPSDKNEHMFPKTLPDTRVIAYRPELAHACGGVNCALLLSQFWYWTHCEAVQQRNTGGWFWKCQREITEETGLTRWQTETARRALRKLGLLEEVRHGIPATLHFRVNVTAVLARVQAYLAARENARPKDTPKKEPNTCTDEGESQTGSGDRRALVRGEAAHQNARFPQTTSKKTQEKTQHRTQESPPERATEVLPSAFQTPEPRPQRSGWLPPLQRTFFSREPEKRPHQILPHQILRKRTPERMPDRILPEAQQGINRAGVAQLKAALQAAMRGEAALRGVSQP